MRLPFSLHHSWGFQYPSLVAAVLGQSWDALQALRHARHAATAAAKPKSAAGAHREAAAEAPLQRWLEGNYATPPVRFLEGMQAPTALSWMRRRGPEVHHGVLYKLFRNRLIRVFSPSKGSVSRVSRGRVLEQDEVLLFPRGILPPPATSDGRSQLVSQRQGTTPNQTPRSARPSPRTSSQPRDAQQQPDSLGDSEASPLAQSRQLVPGALSAHLAQRPTHYVHQQAAQGYEDQDTDGDSDTGLGQADEALDQLVLHQTDDLLFVNKPSGVSVQGPGGDSLEGLVSRLASSPPKLVHRLDRRVSGVMLLARNADAAAWASACFRDKATQALHELEAERVAARSRLGLPFKPPPSPLPPREALPAGLSIARVYLALVHGRLTPGERGRVTLPVPSPNAVSASGPARPRPAVTLYRVRACMGGLSWVELSPLTGRRHQLRYHCLKGLRAPIVGDDAYSFSGLTAADVRDLGDVAWSGYRRPSGPQRGASQGRGRAAAATTDDMPIMLHSRQLVVQYPGREALKVVAPLPPHMAAVRDALGGS